MNIFKFGGASLKNAAGVKNVAQIISAHHAGNLLVVLSAMGKTTDALEQIVSLSLAKKDFHHELAELKSYHLDLAKELFSGVFANEVIESSFRLV